MVILKWLKQAGSLTKNTWYVHCREKKKIREKSILLESKKGADLGSNILRLLEELCGGNYKDYEVYLSINKDCRQYAQNMLKHYDIQGVILVECYGFQYLRLLATAEYLITDTTFPRIFIKRQGQIYMNTWHGTSFKKLGKDILSGAYAIGNVQRNFLMTDFLVSPSWYALEKLRQSHNLDGLYNGTYVCAGYPRNQVFFQEKPREMLRSKLGLKGKRIYCYMPTWRGAVAGEHTREAGQRQVQEIKGYLDKLDRELMDTEILYLRLHPFVGQRISCEEYVHIRTFPEGYEPYELLNLSDCLVTDYSSVFFDYANRPGGKIILFLYDRAAFQEERDYYGKPEDFPFPVTETAEGLLRELRSGKEYNDVEFRQTYCAGDGPDAAAKLCCFLLKGQGQQEIPVEKAESGKEKNLLFYVGDWGEKKTIADFTHLISKVKIQNRNYNCYLTFHPGELGEMSQPAAFARELAGIVPMAGGWYYTWMEIFAERVFNRTGKGRFFRRYRRRFCAREYERNFGFGVYQWCFYFNGSDIRVLRLFQAAPGKRAVFVQGCPAERYEDRDECLSGELNELYKDFNKVLKKDDDICQVK